MSRRTVREVMTSRVVTVTESTPFKELARVMAGRICTPSMTPGYRISPI